VEVRILTDLVGRLVGKWAEGDFNAGGTEFTETGRGGEGRGWRGGEERVGEMIVDRIILDSSRCSYYLSIAILFTSSHIRTRDMNSNRTGGS